MEHWKMHKLGFVNFWMYEREEFVLDDGHLLLRGENGSGKSVTTQSFIPFILDGDMSPVRLDPFGSRARRMQYYLLGDNEKEESTGYLYLEFRRPEVREYLTIGIGLRARKDHPVDSWGFCLHDGRRIGPESGPQYVPLYERAGDHWLPLSKQKLKNHLDPESWAETEKEYKVLVNKWVFGFTDIRQYDQLISLLIKIRAPKLTRSALLPSAVRDILNDSLQVLTDDDLTSMVSAMKRMDELKNRLDGFRASMRDAKVIRQEYDRYNRAILGQKARAYLDARRKADQCRSALEQSRKKQENLDRQLRDEQVRLERAAELLDTAQRVLGELGEDDVSENRRKLDGILERLRNLAEREADARDNSQKAEAEAAKQEAQLRDSLMKLDDNRRALDKAIRTLSEINGILDLGGDHEAYISVARQGRDDGAYRRTSGALQRRHSQIETVLGLLKEAAGLKDAYDRACERLDRADIRAAKAEKQARDAEEVEREERDRLIEAFANWTADCVQLALSEEERLTIRRSLSRYQTGADWTPIRDLADERRRERALSLDQRRTRAEAELDQLRGEETEQRRNLEYLRNLGEAVPPRREQVEATRNILALRGIPCAPFYKTVDFAPDLPSARRGTLEAQLRDAGLLDALVVPSAYHAELEDLLAQSPDTFLLPGPAVKEPIVDLAPDQSGPFQEEAARILRGISRSDREAETALLPDGYFRCGALRGYSLAEDGGESYIGAEARRRRLAAQIREMEERLTALAEEVREKEEEIAFAGQMLDALDREWKAMPLAKDLDQAMDLLHQAEQERDNAVRERDQAAEAERDAKLRLGEADRKCREQSVGLPYQLEIPFYEEARDQAEEYRNALFEVHDRRVEADSSEARVQDLEVLCGVWRDRADDFRRNLEAMHREGRQTEARGQELQAWLDRPEIQARARRLEELSRKIRTQEAERQDADKQCAILSQDLQREKDSWTGLQTEALDAEDAETKYEDCFREDLNLGFSGLDLSRSLEENARTAWDLVPEEDQRRDALRLANALSNLCQTRGNNLLTYHLECSPVFEEQEAGLSVPRSRYCVTLRWREARLSLYAFIEKLNESIEMQETLFTNSDRELFENILTQTVSQTLRARIEQSERWTKSMGELMRGMRTSMELEFSLDWTPRKGETPEELDTEQIVRLLRKDVKLLTAEDHQRAAAHFRAKVRQSRESAENGGVPMEYADIIRDALDYRKWYEFRLFFRRPGQDRKPLTDHAFNRFSGGEKAMSIYVPLFAALSAQYHRAAPSCPRLLALDEAFAGVDEQNIAAMFELVGKLDFGYIMNSQALWGCYECVRDLDIAELHTSAAEKLLVVIRYHWNGEQRVLLEEGSADAGGMRT